jgi:hypothetical protein
MSHSAKEPAHAIANITTNGTGNSARSPDAFKPARATSANATPNSAQTIQDGKYDPRRLREGAPSQPFREQRISATPLTRTRERQQLIKADARRLARSLARYQERGEDFDFTTIKRTSEVRSPVSTWVESDRQEDRSPQPRRLKNARDRVVDPLAKSLNTLRGALARPSRSAK